MRSFRPFVLLLALCSVTAFRSTNAFAQAKLVVEFDTLDLGQVFIGDTVAASFRVVNIGDSSFFASGASYTPRTDLTFDIFKNIPAGDTVFFPVVFMPRVKEALFAPIIASNGKGVRLSLWIKAAAIPRQAYLGPVSALPLTIQGCPQGSTHQVFVINPVDTTYTIDSIRFSAGQDEGWRFIGAIPADGQQLAAGDTLSFFVSREADDRDVSLRLFMGQDTDRWTYKTDRQIAEPYIRTPKNDTISFDLKTGDTLRFESQLANRGPATYRIQAASVEGDPLWTLIPPDTTREFFTGFIPIIMRFAGAPQPGVYTATYSISGTPCDTILRKTVVARVGQADVHSEFAEQHKFSLRIYPLPVASLMHVEAPLGSEIKLLDILGREVLRSRANSINTDLDVSGLSAGNYILVVEDSGQVESRRVTIER